MVSIAIPVRPNSLDRLSVKLEVGRLVSGSWFFIFLSLLLDTQRGCRRSGVARLVLLSPLNPTASFSTRRECGIGSRVSSLIPTSNPTSMGERLA